MSVGDAVAGYGSLERVGDVSILRYERHLAHPQQKVWRAITEDAGLAAWFPTTMEGARRAGAPLHFSFRHGEAEPFDGEMLAFVPPSLMELRWADDILRFELEPDATSSACILRLTVTFAEHGKAARDAAGWHVCLERLATDRDGNGPSWQPPERWRVVHRDYVQRLGPEASVIGPPPGWEQVRGARADR
jgi:uncharacterized protein YndB with AHSA1/START domain